MRISDWSSDVCSSDRDKAFRRGGRPFGEAFRLLRRIIGGVDLYRRQTAGGMFQLLRLRELGWIEAALPRLIGPAADTDMNGLGHRPTIDRKSTRLNSSH